MPRQITAKSKSHTIMIHATNTAQEIAVEEFKRILANDGVKVNDFFFPIIEKTVERRKPSNPQSILTPELPYPISLSQAQREKLGIPEGQALVFDQEIQCQNCGGHHKAQVTCYGKPGEYHQ
jgi:hypothetical protein